MKFGYDRILSKFLTVEQYKDAYGSKLDAKGYPRYRPRLICLACNGNLHPVGETSLSVAAVWGHDPNPLVSCPIKDTGKQKYELLPPVTSDEAAGEELRKAFFANWRRHWGHIRELADYADVNTLVRFLRYADSCRFWGHKGLLEWHLPYIFLATCDFPPPSGAASTRRRHWLRFRFDARVRTIEDLWIRVLPDVAFLRFYYRKPKRGEPNLSHFIGMDVLSPDTKFLSRTFPEPHTYACGAMATAFPFLV